MKTYRMWLKEGQSFEITASDVWRNGNEIEFLDNQREEIAVFNFDNICGWAEIDAIILCDGNLEV